MGQVHLRLHRPAAARETPGTSATPSPSPAPARSGWTTAASSASTGRIRPSSPTFPTLTVFRESDGLAAGDRPEGAAPDLVPQPRRHHVVDPQLARRLEGQPRLEHVGRGNDGDDDSHGPYLRPLHGPRPGVADAALAGAPARAAQRAGLAELRRVPRRSLRSEARHASDEALGLRPLPAAGHGAPWTDEFAEIIVEFGNETWHNGFFADWLGFNRHGAIWQGGPEYGLFARYLIETMHKSPYWKPQGLDGKLRFCLGAGYNGSVEKDGKVRGYGEEAMQTCPDATCLGHANYVGPKWETGDAGTGRFDDHGVQGTLLGFLAGPEASQIKMGQAREALAKSHHAYDIVAYEGGPSGYALPGRDSPEQKAVNEKYGKSLAMAVASLDAWMRSYQYGWTYQNFLGYGQGLYWNSHTPLWDGFRASPGWQAPGAAQPGRGRRPDGGRGKERSHAPLGQEALPADRGLCPAQRRPLVGVRRLPQTRRQA